MSGVNYIAVKSANNLFLNTLSPNGHVSIMAKYLLIRKSRTYTSQRTRGSAHPHLLPSASESAPMRIRISPHPHPHQLPCAFASAPMRIRICSRVRPISCFLKQRCLWQFRCPQAAIVGSFGTEMMGWGIKNRGARLFIGEKNRIVEKY